MLPVMEQQSLSLPGKERETYPGTTCTGDQYKDDRRNAAGGCGKRLCRATGATKANCFATALEAVAGDFFRATSATKANCFATALASGSPLNQPPDSSLALGWINCWKRQPKDGFNTDTVAWEHDDGSEYLKCCFGRKKSHPICNTPRLRYCHPPWSIWGVEENRAQLPSPP